MTGDEGPLDVQALIAHFGLIPLPHEGGLYRQTYRSDETISSSALAARYTSDKPMGVAIIYLLTDDPDSFSAFHCLPTDEIWHHYLGAPVELVELLPAGVWRIVTLGPDVLGGQLVQYVVRAGVWMAARMRPPGRFALLGTTMAPGYTDDDYHAGSAEWLVGRWPDAREAIESLVR